MLDHLLVPARERYLSDLTHAELTRALRALSSLYVERRTKLTSGSAMSSAGKRAAFALFYGPLHFLTVFEIAQRLGVGRSERRTILDLGCGTGAAGAAWASQTGADIEGVDVSAWAVAEAAWTYRTLGLRGSARRVPIERAPLPKTASDLLAAFVLNEVPEAVREAAVSRLLDASTRGHRVLIVEPLARGVAPWWPRLEQQALDAGGRSDEWRFQANLPEFLRTLDKGAGMDHREITARTLAIGL